MARLPKLDKTTPEEKKILEEIAKFKAQSSDSNQSIARKAEGVYLKAEAYLELIKSIITEGSFKTEKDITEAIGYLEDTKNDIRNTKKLTPELQTDLIAFADNIKKVVQELGKTTKTVEKKIKSKITKIQNDTKSDVADAVVEANDIVDTVTKEPVAPTAKLKKTRQKKDSPAAKKPAKADKVEETISIADEPPTASKASDAQITASILTDLLGRLADPEPESTTTTQKKKAEKLTPEERIKRKLLREQENTEIEKRLREEMGLVKKHRDAKNKKNESHRHKLTEEEKVEHLIQRRKEEAELRRKAKERLESESLSLIEPEEPILLIPDDITGIPKLSTTIKESKPKNYDNIHEQALRMNASKNSIAKRKRDLQIEREHEEALRLNRKFVPQVSTQPTFQTQPQVPAQQFQSSSTIVKFLGIITAALVANGYFSKGMKDNLDKLLKEAEEKNNEKKLKAEELATEKASRARMRSRRDRVNKVKRKNGRKKGSLENFIQKSAGAAQGIASGIVYILSNKTGNLLNNIMEKTKTTDYVDNLPRFLSSLNFNDLLNPALLAIKIKAYKDTIDATNKTEVLSNKPLDIDNKEIPINMRSFMNDIGKRESSGNYKKQSEIGFLGKYQMGTEALEDLGLIKKGTSDKYRRVNSKGQSYIQEKAALNMAENWTEGYNRDIFLNNPKLQDDLFFKRNLFNYKYGLSTGVLKPTDSAGTIADFLGRSQFGLKNAMDPTFKDGLGTSALEMGRIGRKSQEKLDTNIFARGDEKVGFDWYKDESVRKQRAKQKQAEINGYKEPSNTDQVGDASQIGRKNMLEKLEKSNENKKPIAANIISNNTNNAFMGGSGGGWAVQPVASPIDRTPLIREMLA